MNHPECHKPICGPTIQRIRTAVANAPSGAMTRIVVSYRIYSEILPYRLRNRDYSDIGPSYNEQGASYFDGIRLFHDTDLPPGAINVEVVNDFSS